MKKIFEVRHNETFGNLGFIEKGAPSTFDPIGAIGVAHDCLEHFPKDNGSIDNECKAFGAAAWIRGQGGYYYPPNTFATAFASEFPDLWRHYQDGVKLAEPKGTALYSGIVVDAIDSGRKYLIESLEGEQYDKDEMKKFFSDCKYWMQIGYRDAKERYPSVDLALSLFKQIEKGVENYIGIAEEGDEIHVHYKVARAIVEVKHFPYHYHELHPEEY